MALNALGCYLRKRAHEVDISLAELARRAGVSRQTLHTVSNSTARLPEMETLVKLGVALRVHPLHLIHLAFADYRLPPVMEAESKLRKDASIFVADVTIPDGTLVHAGSRFTKIWAVQNIGTVAWQGRRLSCMDHDISVSMPSGPAQPMGHRIKAAAPWIEVPHTEPGAIVQLSIDFEAPQVPGTYVSYWKSHFADGELCFPESAGLSCVVRVISMGRSDYSAS